MSTRKTTSQFNGRLAERSIGKVYRHTNVYTPDKPDLSRRWCRSALLCHPLNRVHHPVCQENERVVPLGQWMKVQGMFKMQANKIGSIVMDIAAFKVSHTVGLDIDATALPAARARSVSIGAMERYMRGFNSAQNSRSPATTHRQQ